MPTWTIKADQHQIDYEELATHLELLGRSVDGLSLDLVGASHFFETLPTHEGFRRFSPVATMTHDHLKALEMVAEELITEFGWLIDLSTESPSP